MLNQLKKTAPLGSVATTRYLGAKELLVMYGVGFPTRQEILKRHLSNGGDVICLDLSYWDRDQSYRVSFNDLHPTEHYVNSSLGNESNGKLPIPSLRNDFNPDGPVLLIGIGSKARVTANLDSLEWETKAYKRLLEIYPRHKILYRPKGNLVEGIPGCRNTPRCSIESILKNASLVVCKHSNVAIDACIAGVPVECEAGAAYSLYRHGSNPSEEERKRFLNRLSWWQWKIYDNAQFWNWISHWRR